MICDAKWRFGIYKMQGPREQGRNQRVYINIGSRGRSPSTTNMVKRAGEQRGGLGIRITRGHRPLHKSFAKRTGANRDLGII